jgi:hypothetical protein
MAEQRHVVKDGDDWVVKKPGAERVSSRHDTQREADQRAAEILRNAVAWAMKLPSRRSNSMPSMP